MSIQVTCPNGHQIKVKDHWAGRTGRCPRCRAKMTVPEQPHHDISDSDALAMLGDYDPPPPRKPAMMHNPKDQPSKEQAPTSDDHALDEYEAHMKAVNSGLSLLESKITPHEKRVCKKCGKKANHWSASCSYCGAYFENNE